MKFPEARSKEDSKNLGLLIKMKDRDRIEGVFRGDPAISYVHWIDKKPTTCIGKKTCPLCESGDKAKFQCLLNFIMKEEGIWVAKIFKASYGTMKDLKTMHENDYDLETTLVSVTRSGEKTDTRYNVLPVRTQPTAAEWKKIAAIPLNQLKEEKEAPSEPEAEEAPGEDVPF